MRSRYSPPSSSVASAAQGRVRYNSKAILNLPCDDTADWSALTGDVLAHDTDNVVCGEAAARSLKYTKAQTTYAIGFMTHTLASSTDVRTGAGNAPWLLLRYYLHDGAGLAAYTQITGMEVRINSGAGNWTDYFTVTMDGLARRPGWRTSIVPLNRATTGAGSPSWQTITAVRVRMLTDSTASLPAVTFDQVSFIEPFVTKPTLAITLDDAVTTQREFFAYLASKHVPFTLYMCPARIGTAGYITVAELRRLQASGVLIGNHAWNHEFWVTDSMAWPSIKRSVTRATEWMVENGFGEGARLFANPGGTANWKDHEITDALLGTYLDQMRATGEYYNPRHHQLYRTDLLFTQQFDSHDTTVLTDLAAAGSGGIAVVGFHGTTSISFANFQTFIDAAVASRDAGTIQLVTAKDLLTRSL